MMHRPLTEEFVLDLFIDADHPVLGPKRTLLKMLELGLELNGAILGLAQLQRKFMGKVECAIAIFLGNPGRLLEQANDGLTRPIHLILAPRPFFFGRRKRYDLLGPVERTLVHDY